MKKLHVILAFVFISLLLFANSPAKNLKQSMYTLVASFSTNYSNSSDNRKHNIELACAKINNYLIEPYSEFSFNNVVGARTEQNGFSIAKVIFNGNFTDGVGGGVCQVSTTLYNCAILCGMKISEYHSHTLAVSYVPPSTDAMVNSTYADLKFINDSPYRYYLKTNADGNKLTVSFYGKKNDITYSLSSETTDIIYSKKTVNLIDYEGKYPNLKKGEKQIISYGGNGLKSIAYLTAYKHGKKLYSYVYRKDVYSPTDTVIMEGMA